MYFKVKEKIKIKIFYKKFGYVVIKNYFKEDLIKKIRKKMLFNIQKKTNEFFYLESINKDKKKFRRIENISDYSLECKKILSSRRTIKYINNLTNKKNILFKDKLNFKYPQGAGYLPHIDGHFFWKDKNNITQNGWKLYSNSFTNFVIPLEKSDKKNGCLFIAKKNDIKNLGKNWRSVTKKLVKNSPNIKDVDLKKFNFRPVILLQGDVLFFDWHCAHLSKKNNSKQSRMIFYATYCKKSSKSQNIRKKYYYDKLHSKNDKHIKSLQYNY